LNSDVIFIHGLELPTLIGVYPAERLQKQPIILDLDLFVNVRDAAKSDHIKDALDYDAIVQKVTECVVASQFQLIESLAEYIATVILNNFAVKKLRLVLKKPQALALTPNVGVMIERS
jgi:7,8-dihydroneopterin aldolase/epimerase/oxygenase